MLSGEQKAAVDARRHRLQRLNDTCGQRHRPQRTVLLAVQLDAAVREHAANVDDAGLSVYVGAFQRNPLRGPQAGAGAEQRNGTVGGVEFVGDKFYLGPRA